jgi:hypothetical protein
MTGLTITIVAVPSNTIGQIKNKIYNQTGISPD